MNFSKSILTLAFALGCFVAACAETPSRFAFQPQEFPGELGFWEASGGDESKTDETPAEATTEAPTEAADAEPAAGLEVRDIESLSDTDETQSIKNDAAVVATTIAEIASWSDIVKSDHVELQGVLARLDKLEVKVADHGKQLETLLSRDKQLLTEVQILKLIEDNCVKGALRTKAGDSLNHYGVNAAPRCDNPDCTCDPCECVGRSVTGLGENISNITVPHNGGVQSYPVRSVEGFAVGPPLPAGAVITSERIISTTRGNPIVPEQPKQYAAGVVAATAGPYTMFAAPSQNGNQVAVYPTRQVQQLQDEVRAATPQQRRGLFGRVFNMQTDNPAGRATYGRTSNGQCYQLPNGRTVCN